MTTPEPGHESGDDAGLDERVRRAAEVQFDDISVTEAVLARVHASRSLAPARRRSWAGWVGPAAFASVLLATPFVVALYPASEDALLVGLATGDPRALFLDAGAGFAFGRMLE